MSSLWLRRILWWRLYERCCLSCTTVKWRYQMEIPWYWITAVFLYHIIYSKNIWFCHATCSKTKYYQNISQRCEHNLFIIAFFSTFSVIMQVRNMLKPKNVTHIKTLSALLNKLHKVHHGMLVNSIKGTILIPISYRNSYIDLFVLVYFLIQSVVCKCLAFKCTINHCDTFLY